MQKVILMAAISLFVLWCEPCLYSQEITENGKLPITRTVAESTTSGQFKDIPSNRPNANLRSDMRRVALVIGNSNYSRAPKLPNPKHDARDVCGVLKALQFDVTCLYNISTRREFREAIRAFTWKLDSRTVAFFFYAGHGVQLNGQNYLLPTAIDARSPVDIEEDGLNLSYVLRGLEEMRSSPNIVVLDACRENPFPQLTSAGAAQGLARMEPPVGTMLVYATAPNGIALDGIGENGLFTKHLVKHLPTPGQKIDELFQIVSQAVEDEAKTNGMEQVPYRSSSYSGGVCLAGCENPQVVAEIEKIKQQQGDAAKRIAALVADNENLKHQAQERNQRIIELESRMKELSSEAVSAGKQSTSAREEMSRLKVTLDAAKLEQSEAERFKRTADAREKEITELRKQMAELQHKAQQLDLYRQELASLQGQSDKAERKMQALIEENKRLKALSDQKTSNVELLEERMAQLLKNANMVGTQSANKQAELTKLRANLEVARAEQQELEKLKSLASARESEIFHLKEQMALLQRRSQELDAYQKQTLPSKTTAEKSKQPIFVPSF